MVQNLHDAASIRLMTRAAFLYYRGGLTQQEVAARLGISRATIGRLLAKAETLGIVQIQIISPMQHAVEIEIELESAFGLTEAVVIEPTDGEELDLEIRRGDVARGCAELIARRLEPGMAIGVGWSRTLQHIADYLAEDTLTLNPAKPVTVVQLDGALPPSADQTHPIMGIISLASVLGARQALLPTPLFTDTEATALGLIKDRSVAETLDLASRTDICIFGIGDTSEDTTLFLSGEVDRSQLDELARSGAVGDICGRFFDGLGTPLDNDLARRTMSVSLDVLRARPLRVAAVSGVSRVPAILGALKGRLANGLVTDPPTALALLEAVR